ncbi:hypothetical protein [Longirhabdus pacifica]|uniref:hypothetical protein n=1 Tax=Longirhabdus pacifica TaxID=2305227 RepID=UPI001008CCF5|nr:hypothetical protein [Longirhabdus pacifica]
MKSYAQVNEYNKVMAVCNVPVNYVEVSSADDRLLGTTYDEQSGQFTGYRPVVAIDKEVIVANGNNTATVTCTIETWDGQEVESFDEKILLRVNEQQPVEITLNTEGIATFTITCEEEGMHSIVIYGEALMESAAIELKAIKEDDTEAEDDNIE